MLLTCTVCTYCRKCVRGSSELQTRCSWWRCCSKRSAHQRHQPVLKQVRTSTKNDPLTCSCIPPHRLAFFPLPFFQFMFFLPSVCSSYTPTHFPIIYSNTSVVCTLDGPSKRVWLSKVILDDGLMQRARAICSLSTWWTLQVENTHTHTHTHTQTHTHTHTHTYIHTHTHTLTCRCIDKHRYTQPRICKHTQSHQS